MNRRTWAEKQFMVVLGVVIASCGVQAQTVIDSFDNADGVADLRLNRAMLEEAGIDWSGSALDGEYVHLSLDVSELGSLHLSVSQQYVEDLVGDLHLVGRGTVIKSAESTRRESRERSHAIRAQGWRVSPADDGTFVVVAIPDEVPVFELMDVVPHFNRNEMALALKGAVVIHDGLRQRLQLSDPLNDFVGSFAATVRMRNTQSLEVGADGEVLWGELPAQRESAGAGTPNCSSTGADVIIGSLSGISNFGTVGNVAAFSVGTTSCNIGDTELEWVSGTPDHPVIGQGMYRLKDDRFTQIGQSWLKHGFTALQGGLCEDEQGCTCVSSGTGSRLGVGCSDPYGSGLNGSQTGLGPKFEVNANSGVFPIPYTDQGQSGDAIYKRVQVHVDDLDAALNPGSLYFVDGQYVAPDDAAAGNGHNNAAYRECTISFSGGNYNANATGLTQREQPAIRAWQDTDPSVLETDVLFQETEQALVIVSSKAVSLGGGVFRYEYAVQNHNSDRSIGSFSVPASGAVQNIGFNDVDYHSGEPWDGADWTATLGAGTITWATDDFASDPNANALRWGTLYNFWFETDAPPQTQLATMGLFKPGTPSSVTGAVNAPAGGPVDCNDNGTDDDQDVINGTSQDCNNNLIPDECETLGSCDLAAVPVASGLSSPVFVGAPAGDARLFIVEQGGRIKILDGGSVLGTPYLDISGIITSGGERGLLSVAFDPDFDTNGHFYVNYTNISGNTVIARYTATGGNPASNTANAGSAVVLKTIVQDFANHNGGQLQFGPDGMLYCAMGDGGSGDDPLERAQDDGSLLGKMLRLDVNNSPTYIPADNPYVGGGDPLDEIWAKGLRNPWRFSFDRFTGDMYIGDVGQGAREEIDFQPASSTGAENYGWDCREGFIASPAGGDDCSDPPYDDPILDVVYGSSGTCSITGGYVYRGCDVPGWQGTYFYADFCGDWIRSFEYQDGDAVPPAWTDRTSDFAQGLSAISSIASFGEDGAGELYIVSISGTVYKMVCDDGSGVCGNGVVEAGEQCDDGNVDNGDGCDENCDIESGANDDCEDAITIGDGTFPYDTTAANTDGQAHASCKFDDQTWHDIWYDYTATCDGDLTVSTCNQASYDTDLVIYTGCDCNTMTLLDCNDDGDGCSGFSSEIVIGDDEADIVGGQCYKIRVGGWQSGDQGAGNLTVSCDGVPVPFCGDGNVDPGEECDPPNGTTCDANCMIAFDDCNNNGIDDLDDIANCSGDPNCGDCNSNTVPDECDIAGGSSIDCDGGPIGVISGGDTLLNTLCFGCHGTDGAGGGGLPGPNIRNKTRVELLFVTTGDHPGGIFNFNQQEFADLEAFLADGGSLGRADQVPDECQTLSDCDVDTVSDACELEAGTQVDLDYNGVPDDCDDPCTEPCDDGNACTINDFCVGNICLGTAVDCSGSGDACNVASCDSGGAEGNCDNVTALPNGSACDDSDACTVSDTCQSGTCTSGSVVDCSPFSDQCNDASCNSGGTEGNCSINTPVSNGTACSDGSVCTVGDSCQAGSCESGSPPDCSGSGDDCNGASCDPAGGAGNCDDFGPINEGGPCGNDGACAAGVCIDPGDTRMFMVEAGQQNGAPSVGSTTLSMPPGSIMTVEVWAADTDGELLNGFQFALPGEATAQPGASGAVTYVDRTSGGGGDSVLINTSHASWVFDSDPTATVFYSETGLPDGFAALSGLAIESGFEIPDGQVRYIGQFEIEASAGADGTFTMGFIPDGMPPNGGSAMIDETGLTEIQANYQPLTIVVEEDPGDTRVFMVREGQQGGAPASGLTTMAMAPGTTATVEVWAADTDGALLGGFQFAMPGSASPLAGATGSVAYVDNFDPAGGDSVFIDTAHADWVFAFDPTATVFYSETGLPLGFAALSGLPIGSGIEIAQGGMMYLGEFEISASVDADGVFSLPFLPDGAPPNGGSALVNESGLTEILASYQTLQIVVDDVICQDASDCGDTDGNDINDDMCKWHDCTASVCSSIDRTWADAGGPFGDCFPDGFANVHDRTHVLLCFSGTTSCDPFNHDLGGTFGVCPGDGFCNVHDVNHVELEFAGINPCSCPTGPAPIAPSTIVDQAALHLVSKRNVPAGGRIEVQVLLDGALADLQSYQLDARVSGGSAGHLKLVDISVAVRKDTAFHGHDAAEFSAFNLETGQMLRGVPVDGAAMADNAYLATFTYQASRDADGTFVVDIPGDSQTWLIATGNGTIEITGSTPTAITVSDRIRSRN
jgi:hypothetical protein